MQCTRPFLVKDQGIYVPCGHCRACRIARSREWYVRMYHESFYHDSSVFLTLTYDENHYDENEGVKKEELKNFMKRLRNRLNEKVKYYACGEYGDKTGRAHYHMILFGMKIPKEYIREMYDRRKKKIVRYVVGGAIKDSWQKGNIIVGTVTLDSMRYVADYVHKKLYGKAVAKSKDKRPQPFSLCSNGIGKRFCLDNAEQLRSSLTCTVRGVKLGLPRYYCKVLELNEGMRRRAENVREEKMVDAVMKGKWYSDLEDWRSRKQRDMNIEASQKLRLKGNL